MDKRKRLRIDSHDRHGRRRGGRQRNDEDDNAAERANTVQNRMERIMMESSSKDDDDEDHLRLLLARNAASRANSLQNRMEQIMMESSSDNDEEEINNNTTDNMMTDGNNIEVGNESGRSNEHSADEDSVLPIPDEWEEEGSNSSVDIEDVDSEIGHDIFSPARSRSHIENEQ
jgi:hypothetical protein